MTTEALSIVTGGRMSRQCTQMLNMPGRWMLYGTIGQMSWELDAGGPLDAPDTLPAGGMNNTEWTNGWGRPIGALNTTQRDA